MGESRDKVIKAIKHYQDSLERHSKTKKSDKLIHAIERLSALPIRVWHLEETGVGRTVNGLKRYEGEVGESARNLVDKWKSMVKDEEEEELAKQEKQQEIDDSEELDEEALQIAEQPEKVNGNRKDTVSSPKVKKRQRSEEKSNDTERSSKKSKSSHHHVHSKHKQRKKSESEDSDDSDSSDNASPPPKNKSHKTKRSHSSEGTSSSDDNNSSSDDDSDNSESSQSDSKHRKRKESSKHSKDSKHKHTDKHHRKDKSSSSNCKKSEPDQMHNKDSSSSRHKDKSDKENVSSKERSSSSKSSSSSKHKHSNNDKEKSRSSDKNRKSSSKSDSKEKRAEKVSAKPKIRDTEQLVNGIDSGSGASFADALGMLEAPVPIKSKKKKVVGGDVKASTSKSLTESPKKESRGSYSVEPRKSSEVPSLLKSPEELEPLNINDLSSLLPSITPNYRPLGLPVDHQRKGWTDEEALSRVISAKHQRTKVYSGNKATYTKVPTLFDICSRVLQDNLDALEYTGGVPYTILKHILERANPNQLYQLEFHNPYLIEDTDELWQLHCQKEFRNEKREEMETWRDMYMRCLDERDARLKALTANIKQSQDKSLPVRQTKLAYVDSVVKPPRNIARKQAKNGMLVDFKRPTQTPTERLSQLAKAGEAPKVSVPNPGRAAAERGGSSSSHSSTNLKPKKAPLMAKTLSLLKNRFGRR